MSSPEWTDGADSWAAMELVLLLAGEARGGGRDRRRVDVVCDSGRWEQEDKNKVAGIRTAKGRREEEMADYLPCFGPTRQRVSVLYIGVQPASANVCAPTRALEGGDANPRLWRVLRRCNLDLS